MIFALLFGFASAVVLFWSILKSQQVSDALIDSYPLEIQEPLLWRTGLHVFALSPSTPLDLQVAYLQSIAGVCFVILGVALCCFFLEKTIAGWAVLIMFVVAAARTIMAWRTYKANCNRRTVREASEER